MTRLRPCIVPGCPALTPRTRCPAHQRAHDAHRWATIKSERYGAAYRAARRQWDTRLAEGAIVGCSRCGRSIAHGDRWELDHHPTLGLWPACPPCNAAAGGHA